MLPRRLNGKESPASAGDLGLIPGSAKIPWRRKWQPTLENPWTRGAQWATVHGVTKEWNTTEHLSTQFIREMQINTIMRHYYTPTTVATEFKT